MKPRVRRYPGVGWAYKCSCLGGTPQTAPDWESALTSAIVHVRWSLAHQFERDRRNGRAEA